MGLSRLDELIGAKNWKIFFLYMTIIPFYYTFCFCFKKSFIAKIDATRKVISEHEADYVEKKNVLKELSAVLKRMNGANGQQQEGTHLLEDDDLNSSGSHKSLSSISSVANQVVNLLQQKDDEIQQRDEKIRQQKETIQQRDHSVVELMEQLREVQAEHSALKLRSDGETRRKQAEMSGGSGDNSTATDHSGGGGEVMDKYRFATKFSDKRSIFNL